MTFQEFGYLLEKFKKNQYTLSDLQRMDEQLNDKILVQNWLRKELEEGADNDIQMDTDYERLFKDIRLKIDKQPRNNSFNRIDPFKKLLQVAALLIFVFLVGGLSSYLIFREVPQPDNLNSYCEVVAPYGARSELVLPDGSKVWLNAGSKLRYSTDFNISNRYLSLKGEGFFDVSKNKEIPFVVNALGLRITALGTQFNVKAYEEEETIETTLIEGKVSLESENKDYKFSENVYLFPNQKATLIKSKSELMVEDISQDKKSSRKIAPAQLVITNKIDPLPEISWKDNQLVFNGEDLLAIAVKLERKYNVRFNFKEDVIKNYNFSGTLKDQTIQQVLDVIKLSAPIDYLFEGNEVTLTVNPKMIKIYEKQLKNNSLQNKK